MLEYWGMRIIPLLPLLPGTLWLGVVAPDKGPLYGSNRTKQWFQEFTVTKPCFLHNTDFCI